MKRTGLFIIMMLGILSAKAQDLLVNGGFEEENICTEFKINCAPEGWISNMAGFSNYFKEPGRAWDGTHCMAIEAGHSTKPFQRTFIRTQLLCALKKGHQYRLECYIKSPHRILDSIGIAFGSSDPLLDKTPVHLFKPTAYFCDNKSNVFPPDSNWQQAVIIYTAHGGETFLTVSNYSKRDITGPTGIKLENHFFVYLDNFSLYPLDPRERICSNWKQTKEDIYEQNERHDMLQKWIRIHSGEPEPVVLQSTTSVRTDTIILSDLLFETAKANLQPEGTQLLDSVLRYLSRKQMDSVVVEGHTDDRGTALYNQQLSVDRANSTGNYLVEHGNLNPFAVITRGFGATRPVRDNSTPDGRRLNRRVEVFLYIRE